MDKNKCPKIDFPKKSWVFEKYCILYNKLPKQLKELYLDYYNSKFIANYFSVDSL